LISFATFIIYRIAMCIWKWLFKSYFDLDKVIKQPDDFNEGMDVEKWVSNFEKFADHNNKRQHTVRGQFLLNHMDASSRLVLESYNRKSNKSLIDYTKLKPMLFQLFSSKTTSRRDYRIQFSNRIQLPKESIQRYYASLLELAEKAHPDHPSNIKDEYVQDQFIHGLTNKVIKSRLLMDCIASPSIDILETANRLETLTEPDTVIPQAAEKQPAKVINLVNVLPSDSESDMDSKKSALPINEPNIINQRSVTPTNTDQKTDRTPNVKLTQQSWYKQNQHSSQNVDHNNNTNRPQRFKPPPMQAVFSNQPYGTNNQYNTHSQSNSHQQKNNRPPTQFIKQGPMSQDVRNMPQRTSNYNHNRTNNANHVHLTTYPHQQNVKRNYFSTKNTKNNANEIKGKCKINGKFNFYWILDAHTQ
jgi:hypothetical protein